MPTLPNNPIVNGQVLSANQGQTIAEIKALIIANKLPAGTATADVILENVLNDATVWDLGFGEDSVAASMTRAFREVNTGRKQTRLDVIPVDDNGSAVDATGTTTGGVNPICLALADAASVCFGRQAGIGWLTNCIGAIGSAFEYSEECGAAVEAYYFCLSQLDCEGITIKVT